MKAAPEGVSFNTARAGARGKAGGVWRAGWADFDFSGWASPSPRDDCRHGLQGPFLRLCVVLLILRLFDEKRGRPDAADARLLGVRLYAPDPRWLRRHALDTAFFPSVAPKLCEVRDRDSKAPLLLREHRYRMSQSRPCPVWVIMPPPTH